MAENNNIPQFVTNESFMADNNYIKWLSDLTKRTRIAQLKAAVRVNEEMLKLYWSMGGKTSVRNRNNTAGEQPLSKG